MTDQTEIPAATATTSVQEAVAEAQSASLPAIKLSDGIDLGTVEAALDEIQVKHTKTRIHPTVLLNAFDLAAAQEGRGGMRQADVCKMGQLTGLTRIGARYERLPPGTRTSFPHAHRTESELTFCVSGTGVVWQNGFTFPFGPGDVASWKAGTGVAHTVINDSNRDGPDGAEELVLVSFSETKAGESWHYPLSPERRAAITDAQTWKESDVPVQNAYGPHPGFPCVPHGSEKRGAVTSNYPLPSSGPRPSNITNAFEAAEHVPQGEFSFFGCSLTAETGLRGVGFGAHFEVLLPGTRSSTPHAHKDEDEFVLVLEGTGSLWLNGSIITVGPGDCAGFPHGTGISHAFINDSNVGGADGHNLALLVLGESRRDTDQVVYPINPEKKATFGRWWDDAPTHEMGPHNGRPAVPRR